VPVTVEAGSVLVSVTVEAGSVLVSVTVSVTVEAGAVLVVVTLWVLVSVTVVLHESLRVARRASDSPVAVDDVSPHTVTVDAGAVVVLVTVEGGAVVVTVLVLVTVEAEAVEVVVTVLVLVTVLVVVTVLLETLDEEPSSANTFPTRGPVGPARRKPARTMNAERPAVATRREADRALTRTYSTSIRGDAAASQSIDRSP